jgi:hypothetical protein
MCDEPHPPQLAANDLTVEAGEDASSIHLTLTGSANAKHAALLAEYLARVHERALQTRADHVRVDLRGVRFSYSASIKALARWIGGITALERDEQYRVALLVAPKDALQRFAATAISTFGRGIVEFVESESD